MKLTQLRDLVAVAEAGGLRRAARQLGIAQPALTRSIRDLEQELGVSLFERSSTGMVLTPIGAAFVRRSVAVQLELERARDEVQQLTGISAGVVSIGLSTAPHVSMLPRVLQPFHARYGNVRLKITESLFPSIEAAVRDGSVDFYIGPLSEDRLSGEFTAEKLFDNRRVVLGRRGHPLAAATTLRELAGARWVATSVTASSEAELYPLFDLHGLPHPVIAVQAQSALSMITVAAWSDLLAILPEQWLEFARTSRLLTHIRLDEQLVAPPIYIVRRTALPLTPVAEYLSDLFRRAALNRNTR
ncbi:LysR substrate-binding domain-containing protein [Sphingomonas sp. CROZ-RG-20F-R02-07]|uniref:LysR substrate-binding domain-containing protein n=1 Tax=Sphingomonas sp. CROZ-RG-20F-R02-07 TaxID=2914832 RepID=UPI001F584F9E|nr:LysR substrate-binding domain-containing protein [Sphingomonas sp. CROZ-RG-20F-R02-07]